MTTSLRLRRGTTAQHSSFTGGNGEVTVDTTKKTVVVHDGSTAGGVPLATEAAVSAKQNADAELTTLAGMSANRASFLASNEHFGFRNRIINGDMRIDQRNAGASVNNDTTGSQYCLDRWNIYGNQASKFSVQQNAGSVTPPSGFSYYAGCTSSSAYSVPNNETFLIQQNIEGFNTADLNWGTANAKTVTLSFWVRSSLTGTFGGSLSNSAFNYSYPFSYTVNSANTWEQKSITIAGPTAGTWVGATNGTGIRVTWSLGSGSSVSGTAGSWTASGLRSATGATSVVGTNGATFYITGVQLEKGSTATSFDYRPYGTELALCQRYAVVYGGGSFERIAGTSSWSLTQSAAITFLPVQMRATPTISTTGNWQDELPGVASSSISSFAIDTNGSSNKVIKYDVTHPSNGSYGSSKSGQITAAADAAARFIVSSEL